MFFDHGNQTTCDSFVYLLLNFLFNLLGVIIHEQPGVNHVNSLFKQCLKLNTI